MSAPPPAPRTRWPDHPWPPRHGLVLTVKTKTGDVVTGRVTCSTPDFFILTGDSGAFTIHNGAVLTWTNHTPARPPATRPPRL